MGVNRSASAKLFPSRRSIRFAAKNMGAKNSTLQRAQEIMCKKLKMVRFAAKAARLSSSISATSSSVNPAIPLNPEEIQLILATCGVFDKEAGTSRVQVYYYRILYSQYQVFCDLPSRNQTFQYHPLQAMVLLWLSILRLQN
uniref:Uncharacterized protein n=1 Tax=Ananas comosus var. bracteatus TaxID=296719 RepID=A0A6V7Q080_ANACO|nr:unnamed protein product [Ananas comosus var. bracteatus]